jgi:hypothetical protein
MTKRPSIKGKGADFFLEQEEQPTLKQDKATFYFPKSLIEKLDDIWLELRRTHKKLKKSDIARIAIEDLLNNYEEKRQDSTLAQHINVKTSQQQ